MSPVPKLQVVPVSKKNTSNHFSQDVLKQRVIKQVLAKLLLEPTDPLLGINTQKMKNIVICHTQELA